MATNSYIIQIPDPCKQEWNAMDASKEGRFCTHCSKSVIDFTKLTDHQIIALLDSNDGKICGRLNTAQLNRVLKDRQHTHSQTKLRKVFAALLLLLTARETGAYHPATKTPTFMQSRNNENPLAFCPDNADTTRTAELSGVVLDSAWRTPMEHVIVENVSTKKSWLTDSSGNFKVTASTGDTIRINFIGYLTQQFVVKSLGVKNYLLHEDVELYTVGKMVCYKPTLKDSVKQFFKNGRVKKH